MEGWKWRAGGSGEDKKRGEGSALASGERGIGRSNGTESMYLSGYHFV
jgi:hypothetical protein